MAVVSTAKMNAQQFLMLGEDPPGVRLELVNGEVAASPSPIPDHAFVVSRLMWVLNNYIIPNNLGELYSDVDTILDQYNVRRPDILFFSTERLQLIGKKAMEGPPDLAVEVISPSSIAIDRQDKFDQYAQAGVAHYWIVDPAKKTFQGWTLRHNRYESTGSAKGNATIQLPPFPELNIPLERLWRE